MLGLWTGEAEDAKFWLQVLQGCLCPSGCTSGQKPRRVSKAEIVAVG